MKELVSVVNRSGGVINPDDNDMMKALITIKNYCKNRYETKNRDKACEKCFLSLNINRERKTTKKKLVVCTFGQKPMTWKVNSMFKHNFIKLICSRMEGKEHEDRDPVKE